MKRLLITGGSGYLGGQLVAAATGWDVFSTFYQNPPVGLRRGIHLPLDLRDAEATLALVETVRPDVIIHTACANRTADSLQAIVPAGRNLAEAASKFQLRFIHISSDLVFDGEHAPYTEDAHPCPLSEYGRAKAEADALVASIYPPAAIVRPSLIYGVNPVDHQTRWLLEGVNAGETVRLFTDELRSPIWVVNLALALLELAEADYAGMLNVAGPLPLNRWELGLAMLEMLNLTPPPNVIPACRQDLGLARPGNLTLDVRRAQRRLRTPLLSVDEVVAEHRA